MIRKIVCILIIAETVACSKRTVTVAPPAALIAPAVAKDEVLYADGLAAFHEGTPEGYVRAVEAFRNASKLRPERCDYSLNLAQSLLFLGEEQIQNWEESEPREKEAAAVLDAAISSCMANPHEQKNAADNSQQAAEKRDFQEERLAAAGRVNDRENLPPQVVDRS